LQKSVIMQRWCASGGSEVRYITLELINPAFNYMGASGRILLVNANEAHVFKLESGATATFNPVGFDVKLTNSGFSVTIPGGGIEAVEQLEQMADSDNSDVLCVFREFLEGQEDAESVYTGNLGTPKMDGKGSVVFSAKYLSPKSIAFPRTLYEKPTHPGL